MRYAKGATGINAQITDTSSGGFTAVASTSNVDRDGEVIVTGAFVPLPATVPVHLDHDMRASNVVARARPYYRDGRLMIDATFGSDDAAQAARRRVGEGLVDSVSIVFLAEEKRDVKGTPTVFRGSLLAVDLVSIPANADARIIAARSLILDTSSIEADVLLTLARAELAEAKGLLAACRNHRPRRPLPDPWFIRHSHR